MNFLGEKNVGTTRCLPQSRCGRGASGSLAPPTRAVAVRRQRILRASTVEPTHRDHVKAMLAIDNAVAVAVTVCRLPAHPLDESQFRAMLVNVNPYATPMVVITNPGFQKRGDDGRRNGTLGGATGCVL
jgi:hypothetical protein